MFETPELITRLAKVMYFRALPLSAVHEIVVSGSVQTHSTGSSIYHEGWECAGLFVLLRGRVHLCKTCFQGQESIISVIDAMIMFNEVAVLDGDPNPVTGIAFQKCITWKISRDRFQPLMEKYPIIGISLLNVLAKRNRRLISEYEDLIARPVKACTTKLLLDLSSYSSQPVDRISHSNHLFSARISTFPEAISRPIKILRETSVIDYTRTQITVNCPDKLAEFAQVNYELFKV
jgi:CRP/FNR family transcriptional regulator